ncbi:RNA polymerase recycling motor ATPase HelR [Gordonia sp. NB41Y]|uniref:RNA polymerase recycling motor ATPase HelR n=1 Tax=Gordonia sp. NB41Y TaxID=875808 RepID=UPI0006B17710|nr:RNA polymerase recycling motor ATPase HelR [Gordonia sp. NB41Y]KOY49123.1 ATPase AAA [Gordonia sp. NB41Y]WLP88785.1 RNA polymerase recycling motor ATPase HelR [Gordonia sp. NB41Y]
MISRATGAPGSTSTFDLPDSLGHKTAPELVADDDRHLTAVADCLATSIRSLEDRLAALRRQAGGGGRRAVDRDLEIHQTTDRLQSLRRHRQDLCLGRIVPADGTEPVYIGRIGLTDTGGRQLLVDWRTPMAEPFFAATAARSMGLGSRRRYRWAHGRIVDYWDEAFGERTDGLALDDDSALIASLEAARSPRMRDVLGTIAADQDAIIRAGSHGALIVDGGPGTGKTVVALHRAAYLLYADPRLGGNRGQMLVVGPHEPYLAYISDVLPALGEEGVRTCTLRDMVPEGADAVDESDSAVAGLKAHLDPLTTIDAAIRFYQQPPASPTTIDTPWDEVTITPAEWAAAFDAADPSVPHNETREDVWDALVQTVLDKHADIDSGVGQLRAAVSGNTDLRKAFARSWPVLDGPTLVADLWAVPAFLAYCAPALPADRRRILERPEGSPWTDADLPFLDLARRGLGDPDFSRKRRRRETALAAQRAQMDQVVDDLLAAHTYDDGEGLASMLRSEDLREVLMDESGIDEPHRDPLDATFAHIVVDEAQELTDAQWAMLVSRCPTRSLTIVGDRAQARHGFTESWSQRLTRIGLSDITLAGLNVNYRTPEEIMEVAAPVIRAVLPDANIPTSIRRSHIPVTYGHVAELDSTLTGWLADNPEGTACVIVEPEAADAVPTTALPDRVRSLTPEQTKGLEFDLVVLVGPAETAGITAAVDRYVAMTRATARLAVLTPDRIR